jgi:hypothetical protein
MVTRRALLKGTAAGSIAAIASSRGVTASAAPPSQPSVPPGVPIPYPNVDSVFGVGYGNLEGGAVGGFLKVTDGFNVFFKFHKTGAEVFMKEVFASGSPSVDIFIKFFDKAWEPFLKIDTLYETSLKDAAAGFHKLQTDVAGIFIKLQNASPYYLNVYADGEVTNAPPDNCNTD